MLTEISEFDNKTKKNIKNVVLYLFVGKSKKWLLTIQEKNKKIGVPAGKIEKSDKSVFAAIDREYKEETGHKMPKLINIRRFIYDKTSAIYVATTNDIIPQTLGSKNDGEIISMKLTAVDIIRDAIKNNYPFTVRNCAKNSTILLFDKLGK